MSHSERDLLPYLRNLVDQVCKPYAELPHTKGILSIGSVSYGKVDPYSDIDIAIYYDELPSDSELREAMERNGAENLEWVLGDREEGSLVESYLVKGSRMPVRSCNREGMGRDGRPRACATQSPGSFPEGAFGVLGGKAHPWRRVSSALSRKG